MFQKYLDYIRNTGRKPLPIAFFDEDWEPIGPMVRRDMKERGLIEESDGGILIVSQQGEG